jgi:hypothetical protein
MNTPAKTQARPVAPGKNPGGDLVLLPRSAERPARAPAPAAAASVDDPARTARRPTALVTLMRDQVYVEVHDAGAVELVDRALLAALYEAGVGAGKDGPHVATAVVPPTCYGKIRVAARDEDAMRSYLAAARRAALAVLREARCLINDKR